MARHHAGVHVLTPQTAVLLAALGLAVGAFGTLVGAGGGFILTPLLLVLYPADQPETLAAIGLVAVFANAASGTAAYARERRIDVPTGAAFAAAALPGAVAGALATTLLPRHVFDLTVAALMAGLAAWLLLPSRAPLPRSPSRGTWRSITDADGIRYDYRVPMRAGTAASGGIGFASSLLGIGGGVIQVPVLVRGLGMPTHVATATSQMVLTVTAGAATLTHVVAGSFAGGHGVYRALVLAVSLAVGAQAGARLSGRVRGPAIERLLVAALLAIALRLVVSAVL